MGRVTATTINQILMFRAFGVDRSVRGRLDL
jgi:hypothetical protein